MRVLTLADIPGYQRPLDCSLCLKAVERVMILTIEHEQDIEIDIRLCESCLYEAWSTLVRSRYEEKPDEKA